MKNKKNRLESRLGYQFNDEALLWRALSHRSVGRENNERLEFLGDALLNFIIAKVLFSKFPEASEGDLSRLRATLVQGKTLAELAREFELGDYVLLGAGESKSGGHRRASILADAVEALIGAVFEDSGDIAVCEGTVLSWFGERLDDISVENTEKDPKTRLQEFLQNRKKKLPEYTVVDVRGEAHAKEYVVECRLRQFQKTTTASASSKRVAEKMAADEMLNTITAVD